MDLNINSPAFFTEHYGVDDEVYQYCQKASLFFKDKEYCDTLHIIGILPVAAPQELYDNADSTGKAEQIKGMILTAVKRIKSKGKFRYDEFKEDLLSL